MSAFVAELQRPTKAARLRTEAERALVELRRLRDVFAANDDPGEAERINVRVAALREALS